MEALHQCFTKVGANLALGARNDRFFLDKWGDFGWLCGTMCCSSWQTPRGEKKGRGRFLDQKMSWANVTYFNTLPRFGSVQLRFGCATCGLGGSSVRFERLLWGKGFLLVLQHLLAKRCSSGFGFGPSRAVPVPLSIVGKTVSAVPAQYRRVSGVHDMPGMGFVCSGSWAFTDHS